MVLRVLPCSNPTDTSRKPELGLEPSARKNCHDMWYDKLLVPYTKAQIDEICSHLEQVSKNGGCRVELPSGEFVDQLSAGLILSAAAEYKVTCWEIENTPEKVLPDDTEIKAIRAELVSFKRAVKRGFKTKKKLRRRYYALGREAKDLLCAGGIASAQLSARSESQSNGTVSDQMLLLARIGGAIRFVCESPGPKPDEPLFELITSLASIYEKATGRAPGRGYNELEPGYHGPFEKFLELCLDPLLERPPTIDSIRGHIQKLNNWRKFDNEIAERSSKP